MTINVLNAAVNIVKDYPNGLHYRELTNILVAKKLWAPSGKTPVSTLNTEVSKHIQQAGEKASLCRKKRGIISLNHN